VIDRAVSCDPITALARLLADPIRKAFMEHNEGHQYRFDGERWVHVSETPCPLIDVGIAYCKVWHQLYAALPEGDQESIKKYWSAPC
jgi:hypothetical protein